MADDTVTAGASRPRVDSPFAWLAVLLVVQLACALLIIPPWQNPDEPRHFTTVRILMRHGAIRSAEMTDPEIEREILASLRRHDWWRLYHRPDPDPPPRRFIEVQSIEAPVVWGPSAYYHAARWLLRTLRTEDLLTQFYVLRFLSALLGVLTVWCVFRATSLACGRPAPVGVTALLALHPQFLIASTTVGPASLVNLCGALVWWQGTRLLVARPAVMPFLVMWAAVALAFFSLRLGLTLVGAATVLSVLSFWYWRRRDARLVVTLSWGAAVCAAAAIAVAYFARSSVAIIVDYALADFRAPGEPFDWAYFGRFTRFLFDSSWLVAGWVQYPAPREILNGMLAVVVFAAIGLVPAVRRPDSGTTRVVLAAAGLLVLLQVAAVYLVYFRLHAGPHGRHLLPVIGPALLLLWAGFLGWWRKPSQPAAGLALLTIGALFNVVGWLVVLVPAYVR